MASFLELAHVENYNGGVTERSLLKLIGTVHHRSDVKLDDDEFMDAPSTEEERKMTMINELDLSIRIVGQSVIDVSCILQDMRFVFAVPTA